MSSHTTPSSIHPMELAHEVMEVLTYWVIEGGLPLINREDGGLSIPVPSALTACGTILRMVDEGLIEYSDHTTSALRDLHDFLVKYQVWKEVG